MHQYHSRAFLLDWILKSIRSFTSVCLQTGTVAFSQGHMQCNAQLDPVKYFYRIIERVKHTDPTFRWVDRSAHIVCLCNKKSQHIVWGNLVKKAIRASTYTLTLPNKIPENRSCISFCCWHTLYCRSQIDNMAVGDREWQKEKIVLWTELHL